MTEDFAGRIRGATRGAGEGKVDADGAAAGETATTVDGVTVVGTEAGGVNTSEEGNGTPPLLVSGTGEISVGLSVRRYKTILE